MGQVGNSHHGVSSKWLLVRKGCGFAEKPESAKLPVDVPLTPGGAGWKRALGCEHWTSSGAEAWRNVECPLG